MTNPIDYTLSRRTLVVGGPGQSPTTVREDDPRFLPLRDALLAQQWDDVPKLLAVAQAVEKWAGGRVVQKDCMYLLDGDPVPLSLQERIRAMATAGEDPTPLFLFWERLRHNPSKRSVDSLWAFLDHANIPIAQDGFILAYKSVRENWKDHYSGTVLNEIGSVHEMPRNQISDDPREACHAGFHVGDLTYARDMHPGSSRLIICKVDPEHVVCVPYDESARKMRVCRYEVIGEHGAALPSTTAKAEIPRKAAKKRRGKAGLSRLDKMDSKTLLKQPIGLLRKYARDVCKIVGASKIRGGKAVLVKRIVKARTEQKS